MKINNNDIVYLNIYENKTMTFEKILEILSDYGNITDNGNVKPDARGTYRFLTDTNPTPLMGAKIYKTDIYFISELNTPWYIYVYIHNRG
jgi:hypothetical protein